MRFHDQDYNPIAARVYSSMMLIAVISLGVPSAFSRFFSPEETIRQESLLNAGLAVALLVAYALYLLFMSKPIRVCSRHRAVTTRTPRRASAGVSRAQSAASWALRCLRLG